MSPRNGGKSSRSSSRIRRNKKESQPAANNAHPAALKALDNKSPSCNGKLPSAKEKKTKTTTNTSDDVSDLSFTFNDTQSVRHKQSEINSSNQISNFQDRNLPLPNSPLSGDNRVTLEVSDNRDSSSIPDVVSPMDNNNSPGNMSTTPSLPELPLSSPPEQLFNSSPEDPWHLTFNELRTMRARMGTLEKVEAATLNFAQELQALLGKTAATEKKASLNETRIEGMKKEIAHLRTTVENQQHTIQGLQKLKEDFKKISHKNISEMNTLVEQQREQVEQIRNLKQQIQDDTLAQGEKIQAFQTSQDAVEQHLQHQITEMREDSDHKSLLEEAYKKRHNIVIIGLPEQNNTNSFSVANQFFKTQLKLRKLPMESAYRIGSPPAESRSYIRPLIVKFYNISDRNLV